MEAKKRRIIKSGMEYDHLFPSANVVTDTILTNAGVTDTVAFIPKVVNQTLNHTKGIAGILKGRNDYDTCRNIWHFVYNHIAYQKDKDGYEQIRSPARTWHDRKSGVDCDCYSTFISSILTNLGIAHLLRITKYSRDYFQHIYPVVIANNRPIIIDCVTDNFDYEVPFSEHKDYPMDLQYLNGLDDIGDTDEIFINGYDDLSDLGSLFKKSGKKNGGGFFKKIGDAAKKVGKSLKKIELKKILNAVNKLNPATVALRNGVLASMKLNVGNVAKRLRWSYITIDQAKAKKMDIGRWQKLVQTRKKLEEIFYGAGGKPENLKKAILQGKGNNDKAVHGFDGFDGFGYPMDSYYYNTNYSHNRPGPHPLHNPHHNPHNFHSLHPNHPVNRMNKHTPLRQLLGDDIFYSENSAQSLGELGEPVSMAMITAASGVIAAIAGTLKKIGDIFGGKKGGDFDEQKNAEAEKEIPSGGSTPTITNDPSDGGSQASIPPPANNDNGSAPPPSYNNNVPAANNSNSPSDGNPSDGGSPANPGGAEPPPAAKPSGSSIEVNTNDAGSPANNNQPKKNEMWDKNKKWIVPVGIGVAGIGLLALAAHAMKPAPPSPHHSKPLNGPPQKNHHRKKNKPRQKVSKVAIS